jgi:hypothetical protein
MSQMAQIKTLATIGLLSAIVGVSLVDENSVFANHSGLGGFMLYENAPSGVYEDMAYFWNDGDFYHNYVPSKGNGGFMLNDTIIPEYSVNGAIKMFGIQEDTNEFIVELDGGLYHDILVLYTWNGQNYIFEDAYFDESGIDEPVSVLSGVGA